MKNSIKILVIEDDDSLCDVLTNIFSLVGYNHLICNDTVDIIELVEEYTPQLVLVDYLLPSTNGGELCMQLKSHIETKHIPVIIYSAINKDLLPIGEYDCDLFIEKPFDLNYLLLEIEKMASPREHAA
jgi:CheY-like chemotaxis protein